MAVDLEAVGRQRLDFVRAPMDIKRLIAGAAEEVVVMRTVGQLVPNPAARSSTSDSHPSRVRIFRFR